MAGQALLRAPHCASSQAPHNHGERKKPPRAALGPPWSVTLLSVTCDIRCAPGWPNPHWSPDPSLATCCQSSSDGAAGCWALTPLTHTETSPWHRLPMPSGPHFSHSAALARAPAWSWPLLAPLTWPPPPLRPKPQAPALHSSPSHVLNQVMAQDRGGGVDGRLGSGAWPGRTRRRGVSPSVQAQEKGTMCETEPEEQGR